MRRVNRILIALTALAAAGCGGPAVQPDGTSRLQGEVVFEGGAGEAPAVVEVVLLDIADRDRRIPPLGRERIGDPGRPPVPFALEYSVRSVQAGHAYGVCARALDASGDVMWHSQTPTPVSPPTDEPVRVAVTRDRERWARCRWE